MGYALRHIMTDESQLSAALSLRRSDQHNIGKVRAIAGAVSCDKRPLLN